jgi:hypothetical protein
MRGTFRLLAGFCSNRQGRLYAQLKAERETRETLEWVIRHGALSSEVLEAIAGDPVPVVTSDDIASVEKIVALDQRRRRNKGQEG